MNDLYITPVSICSRRDLNPSFRLERPASLTGLDDGSAQIICVNCVLIFNVKLIKSMLNKPMLKSNAKILMHVGFSFPDYA